MRTRLSLRHGLVLSATLGAAALYAALPGATLGTADGRANTTTAFVQSAAAVARDADGDSVVAWTGASASDAGDVFFQRFDANGVAQGDETRVNVTTAGTQGAPAVAMDATGNFVVAWSGNGAQTGQVDDAGIFVRRFDSSGAPIGGETRANTTTAGAQDLPAAAMDADGDFVVAWQSLSQDGSGQGVYAQRFDSAGDAAGGEFQVNTYTTGSQRDASVAMDLAGNFAVAWESNGQDGELNGIYAKLYAADGTEAAGEFAVNTVTAGGQDNPVVSRAADGAFVVAWSGPDASGTGIYARRYAAGGTPLDTSEFAVNTATDGAQDAPAIARAAEGSFVIAWETNPGTGYDIRARRYDAAGSAGAEGEIAVNAATTGDQRAAAVAVDADGDILVAWQGPGTGDVDGGVFTRRVVGPEAVDLAIAKSDDTDPVSSGGVFAYTLTVANLHAQVTPTGDAVVDGAIGSAAGVTVTDTLPSGAGDTVTLIEAEGTGWTCATAATTVTCTLDGVLPPASEAAPITVTVAAPAVAPADRQIVNTASVSSSQFDDAAGNDSDSEDTVVCGPGESPGTLAVSSTSALESIGGPLTVTRSGGTCGAVSVQVAVGNGTAVAPGDYAAMAPQTLAWANGESGSKNAAALVAVVDDSVYEANETVAVSLGSAVRAALGANGTFTINDNDPAPSLSIADSSIAEGNAGTTLLPFTVTLTPAEGTTVGRVVTVEVDTANGTATTGDGDYAAITDGVLSFAAGETTKTVNVTVNGDLKDEDAETLTVTLSNENPAAVGITDASATGTITSDDAAPAVRFAAATSSVSEAPTNPPFNDEAPTLAVQVTLSAASSRTVTVQLGYAGTAALPADFSASPLSMVTFAPGETSKTVTLTVALDALDENDETVQLTLANPANATLGAQATHVATILDDDALPVLTTSGPATIGEGGGSATVTVGLSAASGRDVSVNYALSGTATAGDDYTAAPAPGTLTIPAGGTSATITVTVANDTLDENNETVVATLSAPQNASLGSPSSHTLTVNDDDATPTVAFTVAAQGVNENVAGGTATATLQLSAASGRDITVPFTVNPAPAQGGDATNGTDFTVPTPSPVTIPAGSTSATVTVSIVNDASNEADEKVRLVMTTGSLGNATAGATTAHTVTLVNDDTLPQASFATAAQSRAEDGGATTVTVQLSRAAEQDVTLSYALSGTAIAGGDYTVSPASPFIIAEGESGTVLTLTPVDDARVETGETAVLTLGSPVNATLVDAAKVHTLTIANDDAAGVVVTQSGGSTDVVEGGAGDSYTLVLTSEPTTEVTVSATSSGQVTVTPVVTFAPSGANAWNIPQAVTVAAVDDLAGEGPHADTVTHSAASADADYDGIAVADVGVNLTDNDVPAIVVTHSAGGTIVAEGGATDSYDVALSAMPAQDVTVSIAPGDEVTLSTTTLTFTPANWDQAQPVTVTAIDDAVAEGTHGASLTHASASADAGFDGLAAELAVQVTDDDTAAVLLSKTSAAAAEGGAGDTYTVRLGSQPLGDVVVMVVPDAQVATDPTEIVFNAVNWNLEVPVSITAVDDALDEASPHAGAVVHGVSATGADANYDGLAVPDVAVAVTDDDAAPGVSLALAGSPLAEAGGTATVTAALSAASAQDVTVTLAYGGAATADADYAAAAGSITIPAGALEGATTFTAIDDAFDEPDESVTVDIASVDNGTEAGTQQVVATIADDDASPAVSLSLAGSPLAEAGGAATLTATLSGPSSQDVTVDLAFNGSAGGADYTASSASIVVAAGQLTGTATLTATADALDEADETVVVDIAAVTNGAESGTQQVVATIVDDDAAPAVTLSLAGSPLAETGGSATITATLSAVSGRDVTVGLAVAGTASAGTDYAAFTPGIVVAAGQLTGTRTLAASGDALDEADETVIVDIATVTNGTESGTQQVVATIADDDAPPSVTLSASAPAMLETGGTSTITATLSAVSGRDVTVSLGFAGSAASPADYVPSASAIAIPAGATSGAVTLSSAADTRNEADETVIVDITSVTNGTESGTQSQTVTITDDDSGGGGGAFDLLSLGLFLLPALARRRRTDPRITL